MRNANQPTTPHHHIFTRFAEWYERQPMLVQALLMFPLLIVWLLASLKNFITGDSNK